MSDEIAENGTANGDVPEIELIIKIEDDSLVCHPCWTMALHHSRMQIINEPTTSSGHRRSVCVLCGCSLLRTRSHRLHTETERESRIRNMVMEQIAPRQASTIDGRRKGACLFCQEYFMDLYLLAELKTISLKVTTVDMQKPPPDFRTNFEATHPPILIDNGLAILENEKIERHIMKSVPGGHNLFVQDKEVASLIENLYSKLKLVLVRKDDQKSAALRSHLSRIDGLLERRGTRFLTGDTMCCFDCELMPRLQHIRVAGKYFVDFEIPTSFRALWRYMYHMYQLDAFTQSCPADQDIINHYKLQQLSAKGLVLTPTPTLQRKEIPTDVALKMKKHEELETPTFTTSIPIDVSENSKAE